MSGLRQQRLSCDELTSGRYSIYAYLIWIGAFLDQRKTLLIDRYLGGRFFDTQAGLLEDSEPRVSGIRRAEKLRYDLVTRQLSHHNWLSFYKDI